MYVHVCDVIVVCGVHVSVHVCKCGVCAFMYVHVCDCGVWHTCECVYEWCA